MKEGKRLAIEADVSSALLAATSRIMGIYTDWSKRIEEPFTAVDVIARAIPRVRRGSAAGTFFSCGVDSFYTLLRNHSRYPSGDSRLISHLLIVQGFDLSFEQASLFETFRENASIVAQELGKTLVLVKTNAKSVVEHVDWGFSHGAVLASIGLALGHLFHTIFIPANAAFVELIPYGSHPGLDPLWSTERLEFVHDGSEARRAERIRYISSSPLALRFLRVCWTNPNEAYNCGHCEKCLRTMVDLKLCGALERAKEFPKEIELEHLERVLISRYELDYWKHTLRLAREQAIDERLIAAIERVLTRSARVDAQRRRVKATWSMLAHLGLTPERIKALDRIVFRGKGAALFRQLQRRMRRVP